MRSRTTRSRLYETVTRRALEVTGVEAVESSARSDAYAVYAAHVARRVCALGAAPSVVLELRLALRVLF